MPQISSVKNRETGELALAISAEPMLVDPGNLLRFMKSNYPDLFREVWYEAIAPQGLILPGGSNGRGTFRDNGHTGSGADTGGGAEDG